MEGTVTCFDAHTREILDVQHIGEVTKQLLARSSASVPPLVWAFFSLLQSESNFDYVLAKLKYLLFILKTSPGRRFREVPAGYEGHAQNLSEMSCFLSLISNPARISRNLHSGEFFRMTSENFKAN